VAKSKDLRLPLLLAFAVASRYPKASALGLSHQHESGL